jgi:NAD(P)H-flavin reductase
MTAPTTHSVPSPRPRALDIALEVQRDGILKFFASTRNRESDLARVQTGSQVNFLVVHPDHVRRVNVDRRYTCGKEASYEAVRTLLPGNGLPMIVARR